MYHGQCNVDMFNCSCNLLHEMVVRCEMGRLTIRTEKGAALKLNNPQNEIEARKQLHDKYLIAIEKLAHYEDMEEAGRLIEVVYGFNQYDHDSAFKCSVCEFSDWDTLTADDGKYNYCPNCGAKME